MGNRPTQLALFDDEEALEEVEGAPNPDKVAKPESKGVDRPPTFWIEEVRLLQRLSRMPKYEIRRITLRRGLNIIWAPPLAEDDPDERFSGHAAGKTSFCRLLRYLLGETRPGSAFLRERLHERFPKGWVVARIWLEGKPWLVARPLSGRRRSICDQKDDLDAWLREDPSKASDYEVFRVTLHQAVTDGLPVKSYGESGQSIRFLHLLAWLSRDQECRLGGLLSWRHKDSQSASPPLSAEDRRFLIRSVVGVMDQEIRREIEYRTSMEDDLKRLPSEILFRQRTVEEAIKELKPYIDEAHDSLADPLFSDAIERRLREREAQALDELRPEGTLTLEEQRLALDRALETLGAARQAVAMWESGPCGVDAQLAHHHCPFHVEDPEPLPKQGGLVTRNRLLEAQQFLERAEARVVEMEEAHGTALHVDEVQRREAETIRTRYRTIREHLDRAVAAQSTLDALIDMRERLSQEISASQERQEALQRRWDKEASRFATLYRQTMRSLLGRGTDAECRFTRENIRLQATYNGDLNSAAINTLTTLGFDLTVLKAAVKNHAHHPRFLLHDSPREADMDANLYRRLFTHMQALEPSDDGLADFQYIITSTESPPANLCQEPWLRLKLDASKGEERLFRMDL